MSSSSRRKAMRRRLLFAGAGVAVVSAAVAGALVVAPSFADKPAPVAKSVEQYYEKNKDITAAAKPVMFAAVGDSITEANSPDFSKFRVGNASWVYYASRKGFEFAGGWSNGGANTASMVANAKPVKADVLVIIAGTNDVGNRPFAESAANVEAIVRKVGVKRVVISAIPPYNANPQLPVEYNKQMKAFAADKGWTWVDAMAPVRGMDNMWKSGLTSDGKHPTVEGAQLIGEELSRAALG